MIKMLHIQSQVPYPLTFHSLLSLHISNKLDLITVLLQQQLEPTISLTILTAFLHPSTQLPIKLSSRSSSTNVTTPTVKLVLTMPPLWLLGHHAHNASPDFLWLTLHA